MNKEIVDIITRMVENEIEIAIKKTPNGEFWIVDRSGEYVRNASKMKGGDTLHEALKRFDEEVKTVVLEKWFGLKAYLRYTANRKQPIEYEYPHEVDGGAERNAVYKAIWNAEVDFSRGMLELMEATEKEHKRMKEIMEDED